MFTGYLHYEDKIPTAEFQQATLSVIWDLTYQTCYAKKWLTNNASVYWSSIDKLENLFHRLENLQINKQVWK